jgi:dolichol kinase
LIIDMFKMIFNAIEKKRKKVSNKNLLLIYFFTVNFTFLVAAL